LRPLINSPAIVGRFQENNLRSDNLMPLEISIASERMLS
jgi:hypothetical protein